MITAHQVSNFFYVIVSFNSLVFTGFRIIVRIYLPIQKSSLPFKYIRSRCCFITINIHEHIVSFGCSFIEFCPNVMHYSKLPFRFPARVIKHVLHKWVLSKHWLPNSHIFLLLLLPRPCTYRACHNVEPAHRIYINSICCIT